MENIIFQKRLNQLIEKSGKSTNQIEREMGYTRNALHIITEKEESHQEDD